MLPAASVQTGPDLVVVVDAGAVVLDGDVVVVAAGAEDFDELHATSTTSALHAATNRRRTDPR